MFKLRFMYFPALLIMAATIGCEPGGDSPAGSRDGDAVSHDGHDHEGHNHEGDEHAGHDHEGDEHAGHDHEGDEHAGHDHAASGPNGGHVVVVGDEAYHVEWLHDDEAGKVTVILLDGEIKNEVTTPAEAVTIAVTIGDGEPRTYELAAINQSEGTPPTASRFELIEPALITAMEIGEGVQVVLSVEMEGQSFSVPIERVSHEGCQH